MLHAVLVRAYLKTATTAIKTLKNMAL